MAYQSKITPRRPGLVACMTLALAGLALSGCLPQRAQYEGVAPMKRNEVDIVHLTHDVRFIDGALAAGEAERMSAFLAASRVGYGDVLQLDVGAANDAEPQQRQAVQQALRRHGLKLSDGAAVIGVAPAAGHARLVVTRHTVTSPGCPNWSQASINNWHNGQSSNFGCAEATNLGAMIADPSELIGGGSYAGPYAPKATQAVDTFRNSAGTGNAPLESATGGAGGGGGGN